MKSRLFIIFSFAILQSSCWHNAVAPVEKIAIYPLVMDSSTLFFPIAASNNALSQLAYSKLPDPLVNEKSNIKIPIFNPVTTPVIWTHTVMVDGLCDVQKKVRVSWSCVFCPSCCFAVVTVKEACKVAQPVTEWIDKTVISKVDVDVPVEYMARVNSISFDGAADTIHIHALVDFRLKGEVPIAHVGAASCGFDEPLPQVELTLTSKVDIANDGQLVLTGKDWSLKWNRPCNLTAMDINVEDLMNLPIIKQLIRSKVDDLAQNKLPNNFDLKSQLAKKWDILAGPQKIDGWGFVDMGISELSARNLFISADKIQMNIGAICSPIFNLTDAPPSVVQRPLPKLSTRPGTDSFNLTVLAALGLKKLTTFAKDQLELNKQKINSDNLTIDDFKLYQSDSTLVIEVGLQKPFRGNIYLECHPTFDMKNNILTLGQMEFTVESRNVLAKFGNQLLQVPLVQEKLSQLFKYKYDKDLTKALEKIQNYRKQIGPDMFINFNCSVSVNPAKILVSDNKLNIVVNARGHAFVALQ